MAAAPEVSVAAAAMIEILWDSLAMTGCIMPVVAVVLGSLLWANRCSECGAQLHDYEWDGFKPVWKKQGKAVCFNCSKK